MPDFLPSEFETRLGPLALWQWLGLLLLILLAFVARSVARSFTARALRLRARFRGETISAECHRQYCDAAGVLAASVLPYLFLSELDLSAKWFLILSRGLETAMVLGLVLFGFALWDSASDRIAARHAGDDRTERLLLPVARKFMRALTVIAGVLVALGFVYEVNLGAVVTSLGIGGLLLALAGKDSLENVVGSINMLFDMPYAIGDRIRFDKYEGVVEDINLRSTKLRTTEGTVVTLPNANMIRSAVENISGGTEAAGVLRLKVAADRPVEEILRSIESAGSGATAQVVEFDGKEFSILVRTPTADLQQRQELIARIHVALANSGERDG